MTAAVIIALTVIYGAARGTDVFDAFTSGVKDGLKTVLGIFPSLVVLMTAVGMFRASGAVDVLVKAASPALELLGIPAECAPLMLLRPISGSAALAEAAELISRYGADSTVGRTAAVMIGSTETTFYVLTVYFGAAGVKKTRWAVPAALCADLAGFVSAAFFARVL